MGLSKYANRRDANEPEIIKAFEAMGCTVIQLDAPTDLLLGIRGLNLLVEVKDGNKPPSRRKLTPNQKTFWAEWNGQKAKVETVDDAIALIQGLTL